jgi:hypothetical protein
MKDNDERKSAVDSFGYQRFFNEYPDSRIYDVFTDYKLFDANETNRFFELVLHNRTDRTTVNGYPTRIGASAQDEKYIYASTNGLTKKLFRTMLAGKPTLLNEENAIDSLKKISEYEALGMIALLKGQNHGSFPKSDTGLLISTISYARNSIFRPIGESIAVVDALAAEGFLSYLTDADGSGSLGVEILKTAHLGFVRHLQNLGVIFNSTDLASAREYLIELRQSYVKEVDYEQRSYIYRRIENLKQIIRENRG